MSDILFDMEESNVTLDVISNDGIVGIRFGNEIAYLSWMDTLAMALRLTGAAYSSAASIDVSPEMVMKIQSQLFAEMITEKD